MATLYKRSKKKNAVWTIQYVDADGKRKTCKGFTDKGLTEQLAAKLEGQARMISTGLVDADQQRAAEHKAAPIAGHLAAFQESMGETTEKHVKLTMGRVRKIVRERSISRLSEITAEAVTAFLRSERQDEEMSSRTYNHYLQAMDAFCNWCMATGRLLANPLIGVERLNVKADIRHQRRALSPEEFTSLVRSARESGVSIQCFDGETRARIYLVSYLTGLRRNEIASLMPRSFDLIGAIPTVTVEARNSKHRKKDTLPLHPDFVVVLRDWLKGMAPSDKLFPKLARRRTWLMVKKDLERVGIAYENENGIADFHAAGRHTHITELLRNGATLPEVQMLARHSDIRMTISYSHIGLADQARAVANLPTAALHGRCISGVADCLSVSTIVSRDEFKERENPCGDRGLGVDCQPLAMAGTMEAAGIRISRFWQARRIASIRLLHNDLRTRIGIGGASQGVALSEDCEFLIRRRWSQVLA